MGSRARLQAELTADKVHAMHFHIVNIALPETGKWNDDLSIEEHNGRER